MPHSKNYLRCLNSDFDAVKSKFGQHDEYDIHGIAHVHTFRKDDIFMQRPLLHSFTYIYGSRGKGPKAPRFCFVKMELLNNFKQSTHGAGHIMYYLFRPTYFDLAYKLPRLKLISAQVLDSTKTKNVELKNHLPAML